MDHIFVAYKPTGPSSNQFLGRLKRKYRTKKMGYSGTLDPFAKGALIVASGGFTRLFQYLDKKKKTYRATLWLGASSSTLDIEGVNEISILPPFTQQQIVDTLHSFQGNIQQIPPKFCAKRIDGRRAYSLARSGVEFSLNAIDVTVHSLIFLSYRHPFVTFEATVSEGTYTRSLGDDIANALGISGSLTSLERLREGEFFYENENDLDPTKIVSLPSNTYNGDSEDLFHGRKVPKERFTQSENGIYMIKYATGFCILSIEDDGIHYKYNYHATKAKEG